MDHSCTYQLSIPRLILSSPLLFHCICAFTAKHLALANSRQNTFWDPIARQHYGDSLRLLISALNSSSHEHALTATILMSSYEMIGAVGLEHRRHFLGAMMLIKSHNINAQSQGIDKANFWVYVRHEISVALSSEQPLLLNPEDWDVRWEDGETREDVLGNHVLWILARVINLVYGKDNNSEASHQKREEFLRELEEWRSGLSDTFVGIPYGDEDEDGFRKVYFPVTAAGKLQKKKAPILAVANHYQPQQHSGTMSFTYYSTQNQVFKTPSTHLKFKTRPSGLQTSPSQSSQTLSGYSQRMDCTTVSKFPRAQNLSSAPFSAHETMILPCCTF